MKPARQLQAVRQRRPRELQLDTAARIFRVVSGQDFGNDRDCTTLAEVEQYHAAPTFAAFLAVNNINTYEAVLR